MQRLAIERLLATVFATGSLVLLATGCGGNSRAPSLSARQRGALAFSGCMRSSGVPRFPDPARDGRIPKVGLQQLGVGTSQFEAAQRACIRLLPNGGRGPDPDQLQQARDQAR